MNLVACLYASLSLAAGSQAGLPDAAMFRGNSEHAGIYKSVGIPTFTKVKWKFKTKGPVFSSPAIYRGTVFVGSFDHNLYAVNQADGNLKWKFRTGERVVSSPAVSNGIVYFTSYDGFLYAIDAATGKQKWKFASGGERRFAAPHIHGVGPQGEVMPDHVRFLPVVAGSF